MHQAAQRDELTVYLPGGLITPPDNPYGRLIANAGTYRALARQVRHMHFQCRFPPPAAQLAAQVGLDAAAVSVGTPVMTSAAARSGMLFSGQPYLTEPAWVRRHAGRDTDYSIVGSIFAFSSPPHREQMMLATLAPLHEWDALICSSPTLQQTVIDTLDRWQEHLAKRVGATRLPRPQLPLIPFGCDVETVGAQAQDEAARAQMRARLGAGPDDVVVYFLGRLSYYDKAFPQAMLKAVAAAAERTAVTTHFVMTGWFPGGEVDRARFEAAAARHAPHVVTTFLDGNDRSVVAQCWAAADVFLLLSDTIIETFGQAVVEAMAAGLPVVVSDWDGYRWIVRDGTDGFLIPTLGAPPGALGETLSLLESLEMISYVGYAGSVAEHTAVDVEQATVRLSELLRSPDLRRTLGEQARRHAQERFAWPVVADQYLQLFAELDRRREGAEPVSGASLNPLRGDPFADFAELPTQTLTAETVLRRTGIEVSFTDLDNLFSQFRGTAEETDAVLAALENGPVRVADLVAQFPARRRPFVRMTVMWLAKSGVLTWT